MHLHQLAVFIEVAKHSSFSKAAQELYLSQSTVSTHISNLEVYFKEPLFDRLGRQTILTPFGKKLYFWANELLTLHNKALEDLYTEESLNGTLKISASSIPAEFIIPSLLKSFKERYRNSSFQVTHSSSKDAASLLLNGTTDIAFTGQKHFEDEILYTPIVRDNLVLVTPKSISFGGAVRLADIIDLDMIFRVPGSGTQSNIESAFNDHGVRVADCRVVGYFDSFQSIIQCVKSGLGCSIVSQLACRSFTDDSVNVYSIKELDHYQRSFYIGVHKKRTLSKLSALFGDFVIASKDKF